ATNSIKLSDRLRVTQRAMERVSLRDKIRNVEIRRRTRIIDIAQHWGPKVLEWQLRTGKRSWSNPDEVDGRPTLGASQVAAGFKRHKTVEFGTPYKIPMSSSGRVSVDVTMMMMK
ncbi:jg17708, partial [Pararge aegeria aegeria]